MINGAKTGISTGVNGDLIIVAAKADPDKPHAPAQVFGKPPSPMQDTRCILAGTSEIMEESIARNSGRAAPVLQPQPRSGSPT